MQLTALLFRKRTQSDPKVVMNKEAMFKFEHEFEHGGSCRDPEWQGFQSRVEQLECSNWKPI